ncbi:hypothetical protein O181_057487 [Austropuccinia psidii MF-1]|uniref:Chromo domain-containing protein n=1 Tax=Austropuccinia psidii MF-1 TaxID=1389203 RepID=A0A9Q3EHW5_9BASI|nr:hypothetical protein [Austropuccinia psidii MF-1]
MVWLSFENIQSTRLTKKHSEIWLTSFTILKNVSTDSHHLKLPPQWKSIHPVFHSSLLKPIKTSTIPNWNKTPPPSIIIEEEGEWDFTQILNFKLKRGSLWYLVKWKGFRKEPKRSTWEPAKSINKCPEPFKDFNQFHSENPRPDSLRA